MTRKWILSNLKNKNPIDLMCVYDINKQQKYMENKKKIIILEQNLHIHQIKMP